MAKRTHTFDSPDRFVAGTIGEPGNRTFFLQARQDGRLVSIALEKEQVRSLADHLESTMATLDRTGTVDVPPAHDLVFDSAPLELPLEEEFRAGSIGIGWDPALGRFLIEVASVVEVTDDEDLTEFLRHALSGPEPEQALVILLTLKQARDFVPRARGFVSSGRPECPLCRQPLAAGGHICPRADGYRTLSF